MCLINNYLPKLLNIHKSLNKKMESVISPSEVEFYIDTMKSHPIQNIGSKSWLEWHQRIQKLHQEAIVEASLLKEEHVKETLVSYEKVPVLVYEAITISVWKYKILPQLLKLEQNPDGSFMVYTILYHEAVCVGLLELVMFHGNGAEALGDAALDLLDYAYDAVCKLLVIKTKEIDTREKGIDEIERHKNNISFDIGIRALTILRYLAEFIDRLSLSITSQMFNGYDVPVLLIQILQSKPWICVGKQYSAGQWIPWDGEAVVQTEAQVWLALRQLLLDPACLTHYPITESRRSQIMKMQPLMTPVLLDQIAPLIELKQMVCRLAVSDLQTAPPKPILLQQELEIKPAILNEIAGKCKKIAREQYPSIFTKDHDQLVEMAKSLNEAYNTDLLESFEAKSAKPCSTCGKNSIKRCSQCKEEWYCSRSCQVEDWPKHKMCCMTATKTV